MGMTIETTAAAKARIQSRKCGAEMILTARWFLTLLAVGVLLVGTTANAQRRPMPEEKIGDGVMVSVLPPDAIPALTKPVFLPRAEADRLMRDDEPVLGLVDPVTGQAKAYSLWHLDRHEIVNDQLGGKPIAVTW